ncbi:MAG TPA: ATP-dependent metallopeptidase FtsH/Yme1/Tma family protein, partial [Gemmatimonadales bacterium]|nr:ATP-dependent metallopeptidase FtsH/Yme1/Tma family protein [Gemmatimonadales bacterium]
MAERNNAPRNPAGWGNFGRTLALWALVIVIIIGIFQVMSKQSAPAAMTYTEFSAQLQGGNVASVEVIDGKKLRGEFRAPVDHAGQQARSFTTVLPVSNSESILERLEASGVTIDAREERTAFQSFLIIMLPWLLILGVMWYMMRSMQAGGNRAFAFGKSKAKLLAGDTPKVTFADVAGADEAKV